MLFQIINNNTLNIFLAYGIRASGKFRTDRYNFSRQEVWTEENSKPVITNFEHVTGFKVVKASLNAPTTRSKHENEIRYIQYSDKTAIPLRFTPKITNSYNIFKEN